MTKKLFRGSAKFPIIFLGLLALGMLAYIIYKSLSPNTPPPKTLQETQNVIVSESQPTKDFAPSLRKSQKSMILIRLSDSSTMKYIVPTEQVKTYIKNLPQGYTVVSTARLN